MASLTEYTGVSHEKLQEANRKITEFSSQLSPVEKQMLLDLDGLKSCIIIDNTTKDNGIDEITSNFKNYKTSYTDTQSLFKNLDEKYGESAVNAGKYAEKRFSEVEKHG